MLIKKAVPVQPPPVGVTEYATTIGALVVLISVPELNEL